MTVDGAADDGSTANSLSATFPLLAAEWHPTLNGNRCRRRLKTDPVSTRWVQVNVATVDGLVTLAVR
jgi:hypothetical protein